MYHLYALTVLITLLPDLSVASPFKYAQHRHIRKHVDLLKAPEVDTDRRDPQGGVNWATVHYTYSSGQTWGQPTPAVVAVAQGNAALPTTAVATATPTSKLASSAAAASSTPVTGSDGDTSTQLTSDDASKLSKLGVTIGANAVDSSGGVWLGNDGLYTNEFSNAAGEDLILVIWGSDASWVNTHTPLVTVSIPSNSKSTVSFAPGSVGAWSAVYSDTQLVNGQISNTWGEFTMSETGVVDISREVNMNGKSMEIVGPSCINDMNRCVFVCSSGTVCTTGYVLQGCATGSQPGAQYGKDSNGADSGGCGGLGSSATLKTTFS